MGTRQLQRSLTLSALALFWGSALEAQVLSGTYLGDGNPGRPITGVGFRPDVVIIKSNVTLDDETVVRTFSMSGNVTKSFIFSAGHPLPNRIQSLDGDGCNVGNGLGNQAEVNTADVTYYGTAFKAAGQLKLRT